jgi:ribose transport system substrate-binding protein
VIYDQTRAVVNRRKAGERGRQEAMRASLLARGAAVAGLLAGVAGDAAAQGGKHKIFLSMSYIGNDWQAEAANMVKAMAAHPSMQDKVDLQIQVAGPNAQRQIQQIN